MVETIDQRLIALRTCNRRERRLIVLLRMLTLSKINDPSVVRESAYLNLPSETGYVFSRLLFEIAVLEPSFRMLSPAAGFVNSNELNLLTALRRASLDRLTADAPLPNLGFATAIPLRDLLSSAGQLIRRSGIVLAPRPVLLDAIDIHHLALRVRESEQQPGNLRPALVTSSTLIAPNLRRILLTATGLRDLSSPFPAQWVKVFVEKPASRAADEFSSESDATGRVYTVRKFDLETCTLTIDIAIHKGGSVSRRLDVARPGELFYVTRAHGGFTGVPADCRELVLAGDETAMPAIASILESLPRHISTRIFIEVDSPNNLAHWLFNGTPLVDRVFRQSRGDDAQGRLALMLAAWSAHHPSAYVWAAGEAGEMQKVRRALLTGPKIDASRIHTANYWKQGEAGHCDRVAR